MPNEMNPQEVAENPIKIIPELETAEMLEKLASVFPNGEQIMFAASVLRRFASGELKPVVHGRWIKRDIFGEDPLECSNCGNSVSVFGYKYCPSCGAIMDGGDNDAEIH